MQASRWVLFAERGCLTILFAWLAWLPLPFGSVVEAARLPLVAVPLALCALACLVRLYATRDRTNTAQATTPWKIWGIGGLLFLAAAALQLIPLPPPVVRTLSPGAYAIWNGASTVVTLAGAKARESWPLTVDPRASAQELLRIASIFAAFTTAALLIRTHSRRRVLACVLCAAAVFESMYGLREAALQRYEIWGWVNRLVFHRVTGTFVNPNHFAHYLALVLPMALFLGASLWWKSGSRRTPLAARFGVLLERHALLMGFTILAAVSCLAAMLLAQSRGALLAMAAAYLGVAAMLPGRRVGRVLFGAAAGLILMVGLAFFLGPERTVARFTPSDTSQSTLSRRYALETAGRIWARFPTFGSGLGTFERVVSMEQTEDITHIYHHVHNDFAELAATGGTLLFMIGFVTLAGGYVALVRMTFGEAAREISWVRRAFQAAALASLGVGIVHGLFDFNFYIPSNPSTLAAIAGAAVASIHHDKRKRV